MDKDIVSKTRVYEHALSLPAECVDDLEKLRVAMGVTRYEEVIYRAIAELAQSHSITMPPADDPALLWFVDKQRKEMKQEGDELKLAVQFLDGEWWQILEELYDGDFFVPAMEAADARYLKH